MTGGVKHRIVSAVIIALAVLPSFKSGAGLISDPCLSLSGAHIASGQGLPGAKTDEHQAWSYYARSVFKKSSGGTAAEIRSDIYRALLLDPTNVSLRRRWLKSFESTPEGRKEVLALCRSVYDAAPDDVGNVQCILSLLWDAKKFEDVSSMLQQSLDRAGWKDGSLLLCYALYDSDGHWVKMPSLLEAARKSGHVRNAWALDLCEAIYWHRNGYETRAQFVEEGKSGDVQAGRQLSERLSEMTKAEVAALERLDCGSLDEFARSLASSLMAHCEQKELLKRLLGGCKDEDIEQEASWWISTHIRLFELSRDLAYFSAGVFRCNAWMGTDLDELRAVISILLRDRQYWEKAIYLQKAILIVTSGAASERFTLARLLGASGQADEALKVIAMLDVTKMDLQDRMLRNILLADVGRNQEAYNDYGAMMLVNRLKLGYAKLPAEFYYRYSLVCFSLDKKEEAVDMGRTCCEMEPESAIYCNYYGYLLADYGRELALAEKLIQKALALDSDNSAYIDSLAWVFFRRGEYGKALEQMMRVIKSGALESEDPTGEMHDHLRQIFERLGLPRTAAVYGGGAKAAPQAAGKP